MEELENAVKVLSAEIQEKVDVKEAAPEYEGLKLVKNTPYEGPTSIKYWM